MSIPGIPGIHSTGRSTAFDERATFAPAARAREASPDVEVDAVTQQPVPLRFPWLSRLARQLEPAARQRPAFASAAPLGERLDRSA